MYVLEKLLCDIVGEGSERAISFYLNGVAPKRSNVGTTPTKRFHFPFPKFWTYKWGKNGRLPKKKGLVGSIKRLISHGAFSLFV
jgi:hypothetical protein